jgi:hypothetical protein
LRSREIDRMLHVEDDPAGGVASIVANASIGMEKA